MGWVTWATALATWSLLGLGMACLFGGLIRRVDYTEGADDPESPRIGYMRRAKRAKAPSAATQVELRRAPGERLH